MDTLLVINSIIEDVKKMTLKEALLKAHIGAKKFYSFLKDNPEYMNKYIKVFKGKKRKCEKNRKTFSFEIFEEIKGKYKQGQSLDSLSKEFKTSSSVLKRELIKANIPIRTKNENSNVQSVKKCSIKNDKEWFSIYEDYKKCRCLNFMSKKYSTSTNTLKKNFKRLNLPLLRKSTLGKYNTVDGLKDWTDENYWKSVYSFYLKSNISNVEDKYKVNRKRLYRLFKEYGWPKRTRTEELQLKLDKRGEESFKILQDKIKDEYEILGDFKGYTKSGKYIPYKIKHKKCGRTFTRTLHDLSSLRCYNCYPKSYAENKIFQYINERIPADQGRRDIIPPQELDVFIPSLNIAIEYNGSFWHSEAVVSKNYHSNKTEECLKKGIRLYHFWDSQSLEIIKSRIDQILGVNKRIYARVSAIKEVQIKERKEFFNKCHISGDTPACFSFGLYYEDELISCISFRQHKEGLELARFACKLGISVVGGFSKLLKRSLTKIKKDYKGVRKVVSYCNRDWTSDFKDSVYYKNNFCFIKNSGPIMSYYNQVTGQTESREKYQKHKLTKLFSDYNGQNVNDFLKSKGIYRLFNSGNWKFEMEVNSEN